MAVSVSVCRQRAPHLLLAPPPPPPPPPPLRGYSGRRAICGGPPAGGILGGPSRPHVLVVFTATDVGPGQRVYGRARQQAVLGAHHDQRLVGRTPPEVLSLTLHTYCLPVIRETPSLLSTASVGSGVVDELTRVCMSPLPVSERYLYLYLTLI